MISSEEAQKAICTKYGVLWTEAPNHMKVGVALNVKSHIVPINGVRHPQEGDTTGWYIWAGTGDMPSDPSFFVPLHVEHLPEWRPEVAKYLGLPPGWRFQIDGDYEDVWQDLGLLDV